MMYLCNNCNTKIRWNEFAGWIHGANGEGYNAWCDDSHTIEAEPKPEDMAWLRD